MPQGISLLVGLGNPGKTYAETRHNAGFHFLGLISAAGMTLRPEARFQGSVGQITIDQQPLWLLAPSTYMNHSGQSVAAFVRYYKIPVERVLVVHDELDLPPGSIRLKIGGGCGGHNGLKDISDHLGSRNFVRLRIGIGHPGDSAKVEDYVLRKAPKSERSLTDDALSLGQQYLTDIVHGEFERVMNTLHSHR